MEMRLHRCGNEATQMWERGYTDMGTRLCRCGNEAVGMRLHTCGSQVLYMWEYTELGYQLAMGVLCHKHLVKFLWVSSLEI